MIEIFVHFLITKEWFQGYDDDDDDKLFLKKNIFPLHNLYNIFSLYVQ